MSKQRDELLAEAKALGVRGVYEFTYVGEIRAKVIAARAFEEATKVSREAARALLEQLPRNASEVAKARGVLLTVSDGCAWPLLCEDSDAFVVLARRRAYREEHNGQDEGIAETARRLRISRQAVYRAMDRAREVGFPDV